MVSCGLCTYHLNLMTHPVVAPLFHYVAVHLPWNVQLLVQLFALGLDGHI